ALGSGATPDSSGTRGPETPGGPLATGKSSGSGTAVAGTSGRATGSATAGLAGAPAAPTKGTVKIGFGYPHNLSAAYSAFGANNLTGDDWKPYIEPIVAWVNAHGGLAGRAVVGVYHSTDPTTGTFQTQAEEACTAFTQDDRVFAVIGTVLADNEVDCLAKANTPFLAQSAALFDRTMYDRHPGLVFQPFMITAERQGVWIDSLFTQKYFAAGAKVGLLEMDNSVYHRFADTVIKPRLAAHGI